MQVAERLELLPIPIAEVTNRQLIDPAEPGCDLAEAVHERLGPVGRRWGEVVDLGWIALEIEGEDSAPREPQDLLAMALDDAHLEETPAAGLVRLVPELDRSLVGLKAESRPLRGHSFGQETCQARTGEALGDLDPDQLQDGWGEVGDDGGRARS